MNDRDGELYRALLTSLWNAHVAGDKVRQSQYLEAITILVECDHEGACGCRESALNRVAPP